MLRIRVTNPNQDDAFEHEGGPLEFGRGPQRDCVRYMLEDAFVARDHLRVSERGDGRLRLENLSDRWVVNVEQADPLPPGEARDVALPVVLALGQSRLHFESDQDRGVVDSNEQGRVRAETVKAPESESGSPGVIGAPPVEATATIGSPSLPASTPPDLPPGVVALDPPALVGGEALPAPAPLVAGCRPEEVARWAEVLVARAVAESDPTSPWERAVVWVCQVLAVDSALVLRPKDSGWQVVAASPPGGAVIPGPHDSPNGRAMLLKVIDRRLTMYRTAVRPDRMAGPTTHAVSWVASPLVRTDGTVAAVLYAERKVSQARPQSFQVLEAQMVQLIGTVLFGRGGGRREKSPVEQLGWEALPPAAEPGEQPVLRGGEMTAIVADLGPLQASWRGLAPEEVIRRRRRYHELFRRLVRDEAGRLVEDSPSNLLAVWDLAGDRATQVNRACRAAMALGLQISEAGEAVPVYTAAHTVRRLEADGPDQGWAAFESGLLTVARRAARLARELRLPLVVTGTTRSHLGSAYPLRRLFQADFGGEGGPIQLYELHTEPADADWLAWRNRYEDALAAFEQGTPASVREAVDALLAHAREDAASALLVRRAVRFLCGGYPHLVSALRFPYR